jgi:tetraacyldisaccharide 4'-kinase
MPPSTPSYWKNRNPIALCLWPLSLFYGAIGGLKCAKPYKSSLPVLCVGGIVAGGSGKTPTAHALLRLIEERGLYQRPVILTRGYGGNLKGPTKVDLDIHTATDVGDEAILHARRAPTIVSKDRAAGAKLAEAMGADIIIMDDGLQNTDLHKDISFVVIDAAQGVGNGFLLPAGPLREKLSCALKKCAAVIVTNGHTDMNFGATPVIHAHYAVISDHDQSKSYYGFAGLGTPEKFERTLQKNGFKLTGFSPFPDHHAYSENDFKNLIVKAGQSRLITTEKDAARLPPGFLQNVDVVMIEAVLDRANALAGLIP